MYQIEGRRSPPPETNATGRVPSTRIDSLEEDTLESVHRRYVKARATLFGVDADRYDLRIDFKRVRSDSTPVREIWWHEATHCYGDRGPIAEVFHQGHREDAFIRPGRKFAVDPNLRSAIDTRLWRLRQLQARDDALHSQGIFDGDRDPAWSFVADDVVRTVLAASGMPIERILRSLTGYFSTASMPVKRRRSDDDRRDRHATTPDEEMQRCMRPMRGLLRGGVLSADRMDLGKGAYYDGHLKGALISVPMPYVLPDVVINAIPGRPIGDVVEHDLIPPALIVNAVRKTAGMLQIAVGTTLCPLERTPAGIGYEPGGR